MTRVFAAIEIPPEIKDRVVQYEEKLKQSQARLNIVDPDNSHITLKFIGEVDDTKLNDIVSNLKEIKYTPYTIDLGTAELNSLRQPRTVWINGSDNKLSEKLAAKIEDKLYSLGIEKESRPFKIHITLARIKEYHSSLLATLKEISSNTENQGCNDCKMSFEVHGFKLKSSKLTPRGPIYRDILEVKF